MPLPSLASLRLLVDFGRLGNLGKVARARGLSVPAVSQALKKLEDDLGLELFQHAPNRLTLSPQGRAFVDESEPKLDSLLSSIESSSRRPERLEGRCVLGMPQSLATHVVAPLIEALEPWRSGFNVSFAFGGTPSLAASLREGALDLCVGVSDESWRNLESICLFRGRLRVYGQVGPSGRREIAVPPSRPEAKIVRTWTRRAESDGNKGDTWKVLDIDSWSVIAQLVARGICLGVLPDIVAAGLTEVRHRVRSNLELPDYEIRCAWRAGRKPHRLLLAALENTLEGL
jgi:DNA-binding transcriptional LysR family regulator